MRGLGLSVRPILFSAVLALVLLGFIIWNEGVHGLVPFVNMEAFLLVLAGIVVIVGTRHSMGDLVKASWNSIRPLASEEQAVKDAEILRVASSGAISAGITVALLGFITMTASISHVDAVPRRIAISLTALVFGLFLSEAVFSPLSKRSGQAARNGGCGEPTWKRAHAVGLIGLGLALLSILSVVFAMEVAFREQMSAEKEQVQRESDKDLIIAGPNMRLACRREGTKGSPGLPTIKLTDLTSRKYKPSLRIGDAAILLLSDESSLSCVLTQESAKKASAEKVGIGLAMHVQDAKGNWKVSCQGVSGMAADALAELRGNYKSSSPPIEFDVLIDKMRRGQASGQFIVMMGKREMYCKASGEWIQETKSK